jgi:diguanylate cyclase (GGDEF)-like protein
MHTTAPQGRHSLSRLWCAGLRAVAPILGRLRPLLRPIEHTWNFPAELPAPLKTEWRLVAIRWFGVLLMVPTVQLIHLSQDRLVAAYVVLFVASVYNLFVQNMLLRRPGLFASGYVTTVGDGLLNVAMISLGGGFDGSFYLLLFTVTIASAMRYGYGPAAAVVMCFIGSDMIEALTTGKPLDGAFLLRSGFLALTGVLAGYLREQARHAQAALQEQLRRTEREALYDRLTGLPNRSLLLNRVDETIAATQRAGGSLALMMVDLDRFKEVNDTLGHHYGDMLLPQVGARLLQVLPSGATVARLGGDEFAILLPGCDLSAATEAARTVQGALEQRFKVEEYDLDISASTGIAMYPPHGEDATSLLRHADVAMYVAKRSADAYAVYASDLDQHSPQRLALLGELRDAIAHDDLVVHFQPKVALGSGRLVGAEALVRWRRPDGSVVQPDVFIPLAEQTGLIRHLSRWVLDRVLRQCYVWRQVGLDIAVAVNLSMRDLHDRELPADIEQMLAKWHADPASVQLEITEGGLMADPSRARETALCLSATGVRLAIDDFGTGYSSLAYLKRLPVSELKIDKSFVRDMTSDDEDATIVRSIIGMAHDLGLSVVAEGVENETTLRLLTQLGCDVGQGYHISRPLPADEFAAWVRARFGQSRQLDRAA